MAETKPKVAALIGAGILLVGVWGVYSLVKTSGRPRGSEPITATPVATSRPIAETDARRSEVQSLIAQCRQGISQNRYEEALVIIDRIREIDSGNDYANQLRPLVADRARLQSERRQMNQ